eukprot:1333057-Prymnesium_polylepis.1
MLRARRDRHPVQWVKLSQRIADVFADAEDAESTAATVEERLNFWLDEPAEALPAEEQPLPAEAEPLPAKEPLPAEETPAEALHLQPKAVEYTAEERQQRISEVEAFWQHKAGHRHGGHWEAVFVSAAEALRSIRHAPNRIAKKRTSTWGKKAQWQRRGHAF